MKGAHDRAPADPVVVAVLDGLAEGELDLPALPTSAAAVFEELESATGSLHGVTAHIARDPGLAAAVLRTANSALWAPVAPIHALGEAVSRLGSTALREIVAARAVRGAVYERAGIAADVVARLWRHCARAGVLARELARRARADVESALLVGLLHDVGRPIVLRLVADHERRSGVRISPGDRREVADVLHTAVGAMLAHEWRLPSSIAVAAEYHHDVAAAGDDPEPALLAHLADALESGAWRRDVGERERIAHGLERFGADPEDAFVFAASADLDSFVDAV